jgi:hypothetical protein
MVPTRPRHSHTIAAQTQAPRSSDHHHIPLPSSSAPATPPLDLNQHWQSLLTEETTLLGHKIDPPPDRPPSATRSQIPSPTPANPTKTPPPSAIPPGLELAEARRERERRLRNPIAPLGPEHRPYDRPFRHRHCFAPRESPAVAAAIAPFVGLGWVFAWLRKYCSVFIWRF